jgi:MSHA biogenesis protein MshQ
MHTYFSRFRRMLLRGGMSAALLALVSVAHAAITITSATVNGGTTTTVGSGSSITLVANVTTSGGGTANDWESLAWRIATTAPGATTCDATPAFTAAGNNSQSMTITAPAAPGTYNLYLIAYNSTNCGTGNSAMVTLTNAVQVVNPAVSSMALASANPSAAASVSWTVTFNTSVTGVNAADFSLVQAGGVSGAAITGVTGTGTTWTVTASTGSGSGSLGLNLVDNDSIVNGGVPLGGTGAANGNYTGPTYTIDRTAPAVSSIVTASPNPTAGASSVSWTVTFSESVTGVDAADFSLVQSGGVSGAGITSVTGSGTTWTVTANTGIGLGSLGLNLVDNDSILDAPNNRLGGTGANNGNFTGEVYSVTDAPCNPPANIPVGVPVTCVCDNFKRAALNPSTIYGQNWITSISDSTGILPSIVNSNYLRLTANTGNNAKAATVPSAFPAAGNYISVEFDHYAYNGTAADGIAVTLSDYSVPAVPGGYGGSLGYAPLLGTINGFAGGWVGVALDEYGNYQNPTEGRTGGPGFLPDTVGVRGSGSGTTGYRWLQGNATALSPGIDNAASTTRAPGYRYQIVVDARNAGAPTPQTFVAVNRDTGSGYTSLIPSFDAFARAVTLGFTQAPVPTNWQISFTGSTGGQTNIHEIGALRICAQTVVPPSGGVASGFAVIDEAYGNASSSPIAVQNYLTGRIYTKLAGTPFKLNVAAINNNQIQTGYALAGTKTVTVKLVDNSDGVCVLNSAQANYCSAACQAKTAVSGGSQTLSFVSANAGQKQSTDFTIPGAWSNLAAIVSDGTTTACSTDAFSVRPLNFNTLSSTANNAALTGTPALRAGSDTFSMTVATSTAGYAGAAAVPTINPTAMSANAAGWTVGSISPGTFPIATGSSSTGNTFTYSEVGHFRLLGYDPASNTTSPRGVYDSTWTAVDQGTQDCIAGSYANARDTSGTFASNTNFGKYGCLFGITADSALFGRFIPDHFTLVSGSSSITPSCTGTTRNFTYMGEARLGVAYRLEARNGAEGVTQNYASGRAAPAAAPTIVAEDQTTANQGCDLASRLSVSAAAWTAGVSQISTTTASFSRPTTATPGTLNTSQCTTSRTNAGNPFWNLDIGIQANDTDAQITGADMNAGATGTCSGAGCNAKKIGSTGMVLGRLNLLNAYGSDALPLLVPLRAEFWNGGGWQLNADDKCTTLAATNAAEGNVNPASGSSLAVTSGSLGLTSATLSGGLTNIRVTPSARGPGSLDLVLNLGSGVASNVNWCGSWTSGPVAGTGSAPATNLSFLAANWCGASADRAPAARIRFGSPSAPYIYLRERY